MKTTKHKKLKLTLLIFSIVILLIFAGFGFVFTIFYNKYNLDISALTEVNNGIRVYSYSGADSTLYNTNRSLVEIEDLPEYVKNAFIDTEDKHFYSHNGYDIKRIVKAMLVNISSGTKAQGASTISQQLIKNALLNNKKSYSRKLEEIILSMKMEKEYSKDEILEMYLNTIYFGSNAYGIQNAALTYFNKSAKDLTLNEACCLAGLIKSPATYSPINNVEKSIMRKNLVASALYKQNHISYEEYQDITNQGIELNLNRDFDFSYEKEAIYEACNLLNLSERELINRGYSITTFKDDELQNQIIQANNSVIKDSENKFDIDLDSISIVLDNSGKVLSYYSNSNYNLHNMYRQPASTLKPLAVYLPCIIHNICTPATQILDEAINYNGFSPHNANNKYNGYVSVRDSLKNSLNIPAVKLLDSLGVDKSRDTLSTLGITTKKADANLALALGATTKGVKLNDLINAYSILANGGVNHALSFVSEILDKNGNKIYTYKEYSSTLFDEGDCYLVTDMLKDTAKSGTAKRLNTNISVASKTGTANNGTGNTDLYNVAYTTEHTILTWIADISNNYLPNGMYSSVEPTLINKEILNCLYASSKPSDFVKPDNVKKYAYDLVELEESKRIVAPLSNIDRYIAYDYFKTNNAPQTIEDTQDIDLSLTLDKYGANISFNARRNKKYTLYRQSQTETTTLQEVKEKSGKITILDNDAFKYNQITYYVVDNNNQTSKQITIKPKDYLINQLNNEVLSNKKKWYV